MGKEVVVVHSGTGGNGMMAGKGTVTETLWGFERLGRIPNRKRRIGEHRNGLVSSPRPRLNLFLVQAIILVIGLKESDASLF